MEHMSSKKSSLILYISLFISINTNVIFGLRLYYPQAPEIIREYFEKSPTIEPGDHISGKVSSKEIIISYMDYQCPYCAIIYPKFRKLADQGKIEWVYRQFPLKIHQNAMVASKASECADLQGHFWEFSDKIYALKGKFEKNSLLDIARGLNLNLSDFKLCMSQEKSFSRLRHQIKDGKMRHILGTPTFYINGKRINGLVPDKALLTLLDIKGINLEMKGSQDPVAKK